MTSPSSPTIAVVGSGPSGCYSAQAILKRIPDAQITVFDRLPVPFGLVRFGVAADHQGTKGVTRQFARLFEKQGVRFVGNVGIGADIEFQQLREAFDAVVIATGLHVDRELGIPGEVLPGVAGAGRITRLLNSHPDESPESYRALGQRVAVVGQGNVAIDLLRLLTKTPEELDASDINDAGHQALSRGMNELHSVGRSGVEDAKFDNSMLHELIGIEGVRHVMHFASPEHKPVSGSERAELIDQLTTPQSAERGEVHWWFGYSPVAIGGDQAVSSLTLQNLATENREQINVDGVITAIGFTGDTITEIDDGAKETGRVNRGLYVAGWARRGPRGTIAAQRTDAKALAEIIAEDIEQIVAASDNRPAGWDAVAPLLTNATDYAGWQRIDELERAAANPGRVRQKLHTLGELLQVASS
ncbi:FAD-dependent oxidoreductase [Gulosibacter bifidus]|uniref:ferredoxin--NADP(+) reductase n=1 Tax=Gulosibacter bifidus TaxID=272239 RepID=A0ABW5RIH7_9MICO|nr:FAD-dependent oxidoreductase [Gulosibacter bifidus]